jgi:nickel/cobalt exporter
MQAKISDAHDTATLETIRPDGARQTFAMVPSGLYLESTQEIPEPHEFEVIVNMAHGDHVHRYEVQFSEHTHGHGHHDHEHDHHHDHASAHASTDGDDGYQDAHERAHAQDIERRFAGRTVTTGQIAMFGLTGGLVPCPASVTILMICLHLKRFSLGIAMVASFSIGLAISLVSVGVIAAWGARQVGKRLGNGKFGDIARKMPYFSSALMGLVGALMGFQALLQLTQT